MGKTYREVERAAGSEREPELDLGDNNMPGPDDTIPLTFGAVRHGSLGEDEQTAVYNVTLSQPNGVMTVMIVLLQGDADLLVAHGRIPTLADADWRDTSLLQEKRVMVSPEDEAYESAWISRRRDAAATSIHRDRRYAGGKYAVVVRRAGSGPCAFAVYAACTGASRPDGASEAMSRLEPRLRKLRVLSEQGTAALLTDFSAALEDATNRVKNERALEEALASGARADELEAPSAVEQVAKRNAAVKAEARRVSLSVGVKPVIEAVVEAAPAPATGLEDDSEAAKIEAQALEEAWNVPLSAMDDPENEEDAVAFEKLMYRVGLAQMAAEDPESQKPLSRDATLDRRAPAEPGERAPAAKATKQPKRRKRRKRRPRADSDLDDLTEEQLDARLTAVMGSDAWSKNVQARRAARVPFRLKVPRPLKYHLLIEDPPEGGEK